MKIFIYYSLKRAGFKPKIFGRLSLDRIIIDNDLSEQYLNILIK